MSVCLFVCLISKRVSGRSYTVENASSAALVPSSPEIKPALAAVGSATVAVLSQQDGVPRTQTSCGTYHSLTTVVEATALFVHQYVKGAIIVDHVTPSWQKNGHSIPDDCVLSTVYGLPLTRFEIRQTNRQTNRQTRWCSWNTDLAFTTLLLQ